MLHLCACQFSVVTRDPTRLSLVLLTQSPTMTWPRILTRGIRNHASAIAQLNNLLKIASRCCSAARTAIALYGTYYILSRVRVVIACIVCNLYSNTDCLHPTPGHTVCRRHDARNKFA